jgi:hypothetical protein
MFTKDAKILTAYQLQQAHPNTPMPIDGPNDAWLAANGYERYVEQPVTPDPAAVEAQRIASLWQGAYNYEFAQISGMAVGVLTIGVLQQKPKSLAISAWSKSIWDEYYTRKGNGSTDTNYSFAGPMPYSVPELMAEVLG